MIGQEDLREDLEAVVGPELPRLIDSCQAHYEDMVSGRLSRQRGVGHNLNQLRAELRWAMVVYINALHSLYDRKQPETGELVLEALQPVLTLRQSLVRGGGEAGADLGDLVELALPEGDELGEGEGDGE